MFKIRQGLAFMLTFRDTRSCPKCRSTNTWKHIWQDKMLVNQKKRKKEKSTKSNEKTVRELVGI